jgi:hypothetical protein
MDVGMWGKSGGKYLSIGRRFWTNAAFVLAVLGAEKRLDLWARSSVHGVT